LLTQASQGLRLPKNPPPLGGGVRQISTINADVREEQPEIVEPVIVIPQIKILIDNGHGKDTGGKKSPFSMNGIEPQLPFEEWSWNREIAIRLYGKFMELGYDVDLLVPEDCDVLLSERVRRVNMVCNQLGKDNVLLISIHGNACGNGDKWMNARGWSAYTTKGKTKSDDLAEYLYSAAEKNLSGMKLRTDCSDGDRDQESDFYILKKTKCPAVLTENFFYDNINDVQFMLSEEGKEKIIQTHIDGITDYISKMES